LNAVAESGVNVTVNVAEGHGVEVQGMTCTGELGVGIGVTLNCEMDGLAPVMFSGEVPGFVTITCIPILVEATVCWPKVMLVGETAIAD
jgi:hypothetical protein